MVVIGLGQFLGTNLAYSIRFAATQFYQNVLRNRSLLLELCGNVLLKNPFRVFFFETIVTYLYEPLKQYTLASRSKLPKDNTQKPGPG